MNKDNLVMAAVVIALVFSSVAIFGGGIGPKGDRGDRGERGLGGASGPTKTERQQFLSGSSDGGRVATTSTVIGNYPTVRGDFFGTPTFIDWLPNNEITLQFNATSTYQYVPAIGDVAVIYIRNASTTAASGITIAAQDTGIDLQDNEDASDLIIAGLDMGRLTFIRQSAFIVMLIFDKLVEGD